MQVGSLILLSYSEAVGTKWVAIHLAARTGQSGVTDVVGGGVCGECGWRE